MNRITLEEVQAAYAKHGIKPRRCKLYLLINGQIECCAMGVMAYDIIGYKISEVSAAMDALETKYTESYLYGLVTGFDDEEANCHSHHNKAGFAEGYEDGKKIGLAIFGK